MLHKYTDSETKEHIKFLVDECYTAINFTSFISEFSNKVKTSLFSLEKEMIYTNEKLVKMELQEIELNMNVFGKILQLKTGRIKQH